MRLEKIGYSADFGGEAAVKRPSPLPLLSDGKLRTSVVKVDEHVQHGG